MGFEELTLNMKLLNHIYIMLYYVHSAFIIASLFMTLDPAIALWFARKKEDLSRSCCLAYIARCRSTRGKQGASTPTGIAQIGHRLLWEGKSWNRRNREAALYTKQRKTNRKKEFYLLQVMLEARVYGLSASHKC